jgi:hypothetical protein
VVIAAAPIATQEFDSREKIVRQRSRLRGLRVRMRRHHRHHVRSCQLQQNTPDFRDRTHNGQDFAPGRHAVKRHGDVITTAGGVHLACQLATRRFFQQAFHEEE